MIPMKVLPTSDTTRRTQYAKVFPTFPAVRSELRDGCVPFVVVFKFANIPVVLSCVIYFSHKCSVLSVLSTPAKIQDHLMFTATECMIVFWLNILKGRICEQNKQIQAINY